MENEEKQIEMKEETVGKEAEPAEKMVVTKAEFVEKTESVVESKEGGREGVFFYVAFLLTLLCLPALFVQRIEMSMVLTGNFWVVLSREEEMMVATGTLLLKGMAVLFIVGFFLGYILKKTFSASKVVYFVLLLLEIFYAFPFHQTFFPFFFPSAYFIFLSTIILLLYHPKHEIMEEKKVEEITVSDETNEEVIATGKREKPLESFFSTTLLLTILTNLLLVLEWVFLQTLPVEISSIGRVAVVIIGVLSILGFILGLTSKKANSVSKVIYLILFPIEIWYIFFVYHGLFPQVFPYMVYIAMMNVIMLIYQPKWGFSSKK